MKRTRAFACLLTALSLASAVAPPAMAAGCQYVLRNLPVPAVDGGISTQGSSTDNSRIVGMASHQGYARGLVWTNGALEEMPAPTSDWDHVIPQAVNNSGVVAGFQRNDHGLSLHHQAFRYENGAYELLETSPLTQSKVVAINNAGDVLGVVSEGTGGGEVVVWPRNGARKSFGAGSPVGINDQRKIVVADQWQTWVIDADTGASTELPGQSTWVRFDNDRVLRGEIDENWNSQITEWDLNGTRVAALEGGVKPFGRNRGGTIFGTYGRPDGKDVPSLWSNAGRADVVADERLLSTVHADITDDGALIGTYIGADSKARPALWACG